MLPFTRDDALNLLKKYNAEPFHIRHGLTVEAVMRQFALKNGGDPDLWGMVGLLHDVDFEKFPERRRTSSARSAATPTAAPPTSSRRMTWRRPSSPWTSSPASSARPS